MSLTMVAAALANRHDLCPNRMCLDSPSERYALECGTRAKHVVHTSRAPTRILCIVSTRGGTACEHILSHCSTVVREKSVRAPVLPARSTPASSLIAARLPARLPAKTRGPAARPQQSLSLLIYRSLLPKLLGCYCIKPQHSIPYHFEGNSANSVEPAQLIQKYCLIMHHTYY